MARQTYSKKTRIDVPVEALFAYHRNPGAFERLTPPWERVQVLEKVGGIEDGSRVVVRFKIGPVPVEAEYLHSDYIEGRQFRDTQRRGIFKYWSHLHRFEADGDTACWLIDEIEYELPLGGLGRRNARKRLERMFAYRHRITEQDLLAHNSFADQPRQTVIVSGASGLIGRALVPFLTAGGHNVRRLVRRTPRDDDEISWDPMGEPLDPAVLEGADAVIHLAGDPIIGRWNADKKNRILRSRVEGTRSIANALCEMQTPPRVWLSASAIGIYGDRGDEELSEDSEHGSGFLVDVCEQWEDMSDSAREAGVRVANLRIGLVLSPAGGTLAAMLPGFKAGFGGRLGSGGQYMSWVAIDDILGAINHILFIENLSGPVNLVAPHPATNREFTRALSGVLRRPGVFAVPEFAAKAIFGKELAGEALLAGARVLPSRLERFGYRFRHPKLEQALRHLLGR